MLATKVLKKNGATGDHSVCAIVPPPPRFFYQAYVTILCVSSANLPAAQGNL